MPGKVCVIGSFMYDLVVTTKRRPVPGETLRGIGFSEHVGGKGFNQAVAAARAGAQVSLIGALSQDAFGERFLDFLANEGITCRGVKLIPEVGTGVGLPVVEADGQNSIIIVPRANDMVSADLVTAQAELIEEADVLLLQLELPMETARAGAQLAREAGVKVCLNPAPFVPVDQELLDLADVVIPNEVELAGLVGQPHLNGVNELITAAHEAKKHLAASLVVTMGSQGAYVLEQGQVEGTVIPPQPVTALDTIGAGDTFCGYLAARLAVGDELTFAAQQANNAAAIAVTRRGGAESAPHAAEI